MTWEVASFKSGFIDLIKIGLPLPSDGNGDIISKNKYHELQEKRRNKQHI